MLAQLEKGAYFYQKTIERLVNGDIPNALHKLPVVEEIRYKRSKQVDDNLNKHLKYLNTCRQVGLIFIMLAMCTQILLCLNMLEGKEDY